jgi:hypothetical protein
MTLIILPHQIWWWHNTVFTKKEMKLVSCDETSFTGMKPVQLISNILETMWNYHYEWFCFMIDSLLIIWQINFVTLKCNGYSRKLWYQTVHWKWLFYSWFRLYTWWCGRVKNRVIKPPLRMAPKTLLWCLFVHVHPARCSYCGARLLCSLWLPTVQFGTGP